MMDRNRVIELCEIIRNTKCGICGGPYKGSICQYCDDKNENLEQNIEELKKLVENKSLNLMYFVNDLGNSLYSIRNFDLDFINKFISETKYDEIIKKEVYDYQRKVINNLPCSDSMHDNMKKIISQNLIDNDNLMSSIICFFKALSTKQYDILDTELRKIVCNFTEKIVEISCENNRVKCEILPTSKGCSGLTAGIKIVISEDKFEKFKNGNFLEIVDTAVHESTHIQQKELRQQKFVSYYEIEKLKDTILSKNIENYYNDNYLFNFNEIEAFMSGASTVLKINEKFNISVDEEYIRQETKILNNLQNYSNNTLRVYNNEKIELDDLFSTFIADHPEIINEYSQLQLEYKIENDIVVKRSKEEIELDYENFLNGKLDVNTTREHGNMYFQLLLKNYDKENSAHRI